MRHALLATLLVFTGACGDDTTGGEQDLAMTGGGGDSGNKTDGGSMMGDGGGGGGDMSATMTDGGGGTMDLAMAGGGDLGVVGSTCMTACDCTAGLACVQMKCAQLQQGPVYCCTSTTCPQGSFCQQPNGTFGQCGGGGFPDGGFMRPDGGGQFCMFLQCTPGGTGDTFCMMNGCGTCMATKGNKGACTP